MIWTLIYLAGYLYGVWYGFKIYTRALSDKHSLMWDGNRTDPLVAGFFGVLVVFAPLLWPIIAPGLLVWYLAGKTIEMEQKCPKR